MRRLVSFCWLSGLVLAPLTHAQALTITVNTTQTTVADDGLCSLPEAITAAESDTASGMMNGECVAGSGADVIELGVAQTYTLTSGTTFTSFGPTALPRITSDITIDGHGSTVQRDLMSPQFRLLEVASTGDLKLESLTLQNGHCLDTSNSPYGGCIASEGNLRLNNSTVRACAAGNGTSDSGGRAGAIYSGNGFLEIVSSLITENAAGDSQNQGGGSGGALYKSGGTLSITDSVISLNTAGSGNTGAGSGGGVSLQNATASLVRTTVTDNQAGNSNGLGGRGGGIFAAFSTVLLDECSITGNHSGSGGIVGGSGGGIHINGGSLTATSTSFAMNVIPDGVIGTMQGNPAGSGAGVFLTGANATLVGCSITQNIAGAGGAATTAGGDGGAGGRASALSAESAASLEIIGCSIANNLGGDGGSAMGAGNGGDGGGDTVNLFQIASATIYDTTIRDNYAGHGGSAGIGGIGGDGGRSGGLVSEANLTLVRSAITGNRAGRGGDAEYPGRGGDGGGLRLRSTSVVANTTISGNQAGNGGDTIAIGPNGGTGGSGGGIYIGAVSHSLTNTTIAGNSAGIGGSGGLAKSSPGVGGGIALIPGATTMLTNNIVANNGLGGDCHDEGSTINDLGSNLVEDDSCGFSGGTDPRLGPLQSNGGPTLSHALCTAVGVPDASCVGISPAIDGGSDSDCGAAPVDNIDQRGAARPQGSKCDIGAVEASSPVLLTIQGNSATRPGRSACIRVGLGAGISVDSVTNQMDFDNTNLQLSGVTINPSIGPMTLSDKRVSHVSLAAGSELFGVSGGSADIPSGALYLAQFAVSPSAPAGTYPLTPTTGGSLIVSSCTGDCNGSGGVSLGEVQTCVNKFLGQPLCGFSGANCPMADANGLGTVSIGEVQQCVNRFLGGCN